MKAEKKFMTTATENNKIGLLTAIIISVNAMLGAGIFLLPRKMALLCGPIGILTTICVAATVWFIGYCIARVATNIPGEGSFYLYTKQWGGHRLGLIVSALYIIGLTIAIGLLFRTAGDYLHHYFPNTDPLYLGAALWAIVVALNISGAHLSSIGQRILIVTTVAPLILITILCFSKAHIGYLIPFAPYGHTSALFATRLVIFGFFGFEAIPPPTLLLAGAAVVWEDISSDGYVLPLLVVSKDASCIANSWMVSPETSLSIICRGSKMKDDQN